MPDMPKPWDVFFYVMLFIIIMVFVGSPVLNAFGTLAIAGNGITGGLSNSVYTTILGGISTVDSLITPAIIIILMIDLVLGWGKPSKEMAILNIVFAIVVGLLYANANIPILNNSNTFNAILPNTYSAWTGGYIVFIVFFACIVGAIMNARKPDGAQGDINEPE